jgi:hypothetical protein
MAFLRGSGLVVVLEVERIAHERTAGSSLSGIPPAASGCDSTDDP